MQSPHQWRYVTTPVWVDLGRCLWSRPAGHVSLSGPLADAYLWRLPTTRPVPQNVPTDQHSAEGRQDVAREQNEPASDVCRVADLPNVEQPQDEVESYQDNAREECQQRTPAHGIGRPTSRHVGDPRCAGRVWTQPIVLFARGSTQPLSRRPPSVPKRPI
jgi:hypothetical protein